MGIKRYKIHGEGFTYIREDSNGDYVLYEDVKHLIELGRANALEHVSREEAQDTTAEGSWLLAQFLFSERNLCRES